MSFGTGGLSPSSFQAEMARLGEIFTPLDDRKLDVLYEEFRYINLHTLREAVKALIGQHPHRRFPLPSEIWAAIRAVRQTEAARRHRDEALERAGECARCQGMGWEQLPDREVDGTVYSFVDYCSCRMGQSMRAGHERAIQRRGKERAKLTYRDVDGVVPDADGPMAG